MMQFIRTFRHSKKVFTLVFLLLVWSIVCGTPTVSAQYKKTCVASWAQGFTQIDTILDELITKNFDSSRANRISGSDSALSYTAIMGGYSCNLRRICAMVRESAEGKDVTKAPLSDLVVSVPGCGENISSFSSSGETVEQKATHSNLLNLVNISDNLQSCRGDNDTTAIRLAAEESCLKVVQAKEKIIGGKVQAAIRVSSQRKSVGFLSGKIYSLQKRIAALGEEVDTSLANITRQFFGTLNSVLGKIGYRVDKTVTAQ